MAAAQPVPKRRLRLAGMMGLASNCGDTYVDLIELLMLGLKWALTFVEDLPPNPEKGKSENVPQINIVVKPTDHGVA